MSDESDLGSKSDGDLAPLGQSGTRINSLDFIRGIAVMGILAANIISFGQSMTAYLYPGAFVPGHSAMDDNLWVAQFVLIDGKMRGLFSLLFGAGLYLFIERAWAKGQGISLQARRLAWLGLFGLVHFFFIWRGDILFLYSCAGLVALAFLRLSPTRQMVLGLTGYFFGGLLYLGMTAPMQVVADGEHPAGSSYEAIQGGLIEGQDDDLVEDVVEADIILNGGYLDYVAYNLTEQAASLGMTLFIFWFETLPLMLIGMALYRIGFFEGRLDRAKQLRWGWAFLGIGAALHLAIGVWAKAGGLTYYGTLAAIAGWSHYPRLMMVLGLAALLVLWAPHATGWFGARVSAAGRAAFTNYLGTSIVMICIFHGWGFGLYQSLDRSQLYLVTLAAWVFMLLWSKPWLDRFRYGPLEWLWRCLTYGRLFRLRR